MKMLGILIVSFVLPVSVMATSLSEKVHIKGLHGKVEVTRDVNNVPTIKGDKIQDVFFMTGYIQAQDRFFQMDLLRKNARGQLSELFGPSLLSRDIELRLVGIERAALASLAKETPEMNALVQSYADGVNYYMNHHDLPIQYQFLGLTKEQVKPWEILDTYSVLYSIVYDLNFSLSDIDFSQVLSDFRHDLPAEFDAEALFSQDMIRVAPLTNEVVIPGFCENGICGSGSQYAENTAKSKSIWKPQTDANQGDVYFPPLIASAAYNQDFLHSDSNLEQYVERAKNYTQWDVGSNSWSVAKKLTENNRSLSANDPHLSLASPGTLYQLHQIINGGPHKANVRGVGIPGSPLVSILCNKNLCASNTNTNGFDYTDVYREQVVPCENSAAGLCVLNAGNEVPLIPVVQTYKVNSFSVQGVVDSGITPEDLGGTMLLLPHRNNGAIIDLDFNTGSAISYQFFASKGGATGSLYLELYQAKTVYDVKDIVGRIDAFGQYFNVADSKGNIGLFVAGAMPIRKDLQNGTVVGAPPYLIRDGISGENDWLPAQSNTRQDFEFLLGDERPNVINPVRGIIVQANNDPVGVVTDNDALNQYRQNGGIYYLGAYTFANGARASRIDGELERFLQDDQKLSISHMKKIQSNNASVSSELLTPVLLEAYKNAQHADSFPELKALYENSKIQEAMAYLAQWDYSTPTGIQQGYDPNDDPENLPVPTDEEKRHSVAATLYSVWQAKLSSRVISHSLEEMGVVAWRLDATKVLHNLFQNFDENATGTNCRDVRGKNGIGFSGVNFFNTGLDADRNCQEARDYVVLLSLKEALERLASDDFALTFQNSNDISTYHWGLLHRVINRDGAGFFNAPPSGIVSDLSPDLPGASKAGGRDTVDVSPNSISADADNEFTVSFGPNWRRVTELQRSGKHQYFDIVNLGNSEDVSSPFFSDQFPLWLTNRYVERPMKKAFGDKTIFVPKLKD